MKETERTIIKEDNLNPIRVQTILEIKKIKQIIPAYIGVNLKSSRFVTGRITVLRRTLTDILEHAVEDETICLWLQTFRIESFKTMRYKGWANNRTLPTNHPHYDPNNPSRSKHDTDTDYFLYYTIKINRWNYWVNVKMHRDYGEVVYTIEKNKPADLIRGYKKSDIENVYSSAYGWRESHQYHDAKIE